MKAVLALCVLGVLLGCSYAGVREDLKMFNEFKMDYNKMYASPDEEASRFAIFRDNLRRAEELTKQSGGLAEYGVTQFMDLSPEEFADMYLNKALIERSETEAEAELAVEEAPRNPDESPRRAGAVPSTFDWRSKNVVTSPYNQQQCGDCWAFSVTEALESFWALAGHPLTSLSMQQVTSCDHKDYGCGGGEPNTAWEYIINAGGLEDYQDYPFSSGDGKTGYCQFNAKDIVATMKDWQWVSRAPKQNESGMVSALYNYGPYSICVDASSWQTYRSGIVTKNCGTRLDHCVQLVGYNTSNGIDYWVVRNSWGKFWGEAGYIWIERGKNLCGIANEASRPCIESC